MRALLRKIGEKICRKVELPCLLIDLLQILNYVADKVGPVNVLATCCLVTAILGFNWIEVDSEAGMITFSLLYGYV